MTLEWPSQQAGSQHEPVQAVQYLLRAHGHLVAVDGIFGPVTTGAVRAFQTAKQLTADGIVGNRTWPALVITVQRGSTGDAVRGIQDQARYRTGGSGEGPGFAIDGIYGPKTEGFVRDFQKNVHIVIDGVVGPITWNHLVKGEQNY